MKQVQDITKYFFVDESGDPYFYDRFGTYIVGKEGCSKILLLGFVETEKPEEIRTKLHNVRQTIQTDVYLQSIPSVKKSLIAFHAKDDCAEVREKVFKTILTMDFRAEIIVARKVESIFMSRHKKRSNLFYDDLVTKLFQNQLHTSTQNIIYFAVRGNRARQLPLENSIQAAILTFEEKWRTKVSSEVKVYPQRPEGEPCLQVTDYMNWAVQRAFVKKEMRYFNFVREKISLIADIYDFDKYPNNYYNRAHPFDTNKTSPL